MPRCVYTSGGTEDKTMEVHIVTLLMSGKVIVLYAQKEDLKLEKNLFPNMHSRKRHRLEMIGRISNGRSARQDHILLNEAH